MRPRPLTLFLGRRAALRAFPFDPLDRVLSKVKEVWPVGASKWRGICPAHPDLNPSLNIALTEEGRILLHCFGGCGIERVLAALDLKFSDLFIAMTAKRRKMEEPHKEPGWVSHIYEDLLRRLKLKKEHRAHLLTRGFTHFEIDSNGYRSYDLSVRKRLLELLPSRWDNNTLFQTPGFIRGPLSTLGMIEDDGLLIPVRDKEKVVALKIRRFSFGPKYRWFSFPGQLRAKPHIPKGCAPNSKNLLIVEGALKADYMTKEFPDWFIIGLPGVNSGDTIRSYIDGRHFSKIFVGLDLDVKDKPVHSRLMELAKNYSPLVKQLTWNGPNGIDEARKERVEFYVKS